MLMNKKFIIYGFGRMGLTHYAILNQLIDKTDFVFVDPNKKVNYFAKTNLNAKKLEIDFDHDDFFNQFEPT
jgi:hypothetical protein